MDSGQHLSPCWVRILSQHLQQAKPFIGENCDILMQRMQVILIYNPL